MTAGASTNDAVLVTGAGGPAGVAVIKSLVATGRRTIATDADAGAVGLRLASAGKPVPMADDPGFVDAVISVALEHRVGVLVPTVAEELPALAAAESRLGGSGVAMWLAPAESVACCNDKWLFHQAALDAGCPVPDTALGSTVGVAGPWIVKPRWGRGSRHIFAVDTVDQVEDVLAMVPEPMVQTRIEGREFTVDAMVDRDGQVVGCVPRWRIETKAGISTRGRTFAPSDELAAAVDGILAATGLVGPANIQGFVTPTDRVVLTEVNPRFSGGLPLSLAAGADLVGEYIRAIEGHAIRPDRLEFTPGVEMYRYFEEIFEYPR